MSLTPDEFWKLTPREFSMMVEGRRWKEERELEKMAYFTSCLMNATGNFQTPVTADKLLGRNTQIKDVTKVDKTPEQYKAEVRELAKELGFDDTEIL